MPSTLVILAHPRPSQSLATRALCQALADAGNVEVRSLYALYPDFDIDVAAEQRALAQAQLVVWLAPVYWYSVPALLKHWIDQVLAHGWAFGPGGEALQGKTAWWVTSAGGGPADYQAGGVHQRALQDFVPPLEQTARFCGMRWLPPHVLYRGHQLEEAALRQAREDLALTLARHRQDLGLLPASHAEAETPATPE